MTAAAAVAVAENNLPLAQLSPARRRRESLNRFDSRRRESGGRIDSQKRGGESISRLARAILASLPKTA